jgi:hypothetical protein
MREAAAPPPAFLYSPDSARALCEAVPGMMQSAEALRAMCLRPTIHDRAVIAAIIFDFVASRKRKVYGGHAINAAIVQALGSQASIYPPNSAQEDIEFYSPQPIHDVQAICDILYARGFKFVRGKEAAHHGTYTISVMFVRICDVTFTPPSVFNVIPVMSLPRPASFAPVETQQTQQQQENVMYVHPRHVIIDMLHILSDPFTSHWKLDRVVPRLLTLQSCYPITPVVIPSRDNKPVSPRAVHIPSSEVISTIIQDVAAWAAAACNSVALVGSVADTFYRTNIDVPAIYDSVRAARAKDATILFEMTMCSTNYVTDLGTLTACLTRHGFGDPTEYFPMSSWLDQRASFVAIVQSNPKHRIEITLCDTRKKVVPVAAKTDDGIWVASTTYVIAHALASKFAHTCIGSFYLAKHFGAIAHSVTLSRAYGLRDVHETAASFTSIFRDVNLGYLGTPFSDMHIHMQAADDKRFHATTQRNKAALGGIWFTYDPSHRRGNRGSGSNEYEICNRMLPCDGSVVKSANYSPLQQLRMQQQQQQ